MKKSKSKELDEDKLELESQRAYLEDSKKKLFHRYTMEELNEHRLWIAIFCYEQVYLTSAKNPKLFNVYCELMEDYRLKNIYDTYFILTKEDYLERIGGV